jgi:hypothetical protein
VEAGIFAFELYGQLAERARREASTYTRTESPDDEFMAQFLSRTIVTNEQRHQEAVERAQEMESVRNAELATLGQTFLRDANEANAFSKLSRYETAIERSLYKAVHELQRLQAARRTVGEVPPPMAVDVEVSGVGPREEL